MELEIHNPIELKMVLLDSEDRLPSMKFRVEVIINHPTGTSSYDANDIWIDCVQWDGFIKMLTSIIGNPKEIALLTSMSEGFQLKVTSEEGHISFELLCKEPETGMGVMELKYCSDIGLDEVAAIKRAFDEFPRWW